MNQVETIKSSSMFLAKEDDTVTQKEEKVDKQTPHPDSCTSSVEADSCTSSVEAVATSGSTVSIYLDDGLSEEPKPSKTPQPQRRLTMVSIGNVSLVEVSLVISLGDLIYPWSSSHVM